MSGQILEPKLTAYDLKVLRLVPEHGSGPMASRADHVTVWQVAEALDTDDVQGIRLVLSGLEHLGYVCQAKSRRKPRTVYWRSPKGDEVLTSNPDRSGDSPAQLPTGGQA